MQRWFRLGGSYNSWLSVWPSVAIWARSLVFGLSLSHWIAGNGDGATASVAASGFICGATEPSGPVSRALTRSARTQCAPPRNPHTPLGPNPSLRGTQAPLLVGRVLITHRDGVAGFVFAPLVNRFALAVGVQTQVHPGFHARSPATRPRPGGPAGAPECLGVRSAGLSGRSSPTNQEVPDDQGRPRSDQGRSGTLCARRLSPRISTLFFVKRRQTRDSDDY